MTTGTILALIVIVAIVVSAGYVVVRDMKRGGCSGCGRCGCCDKTCITIEDEESGRR
ncbi:MAG: FeoB-associated Cys-rich membrane protein [Candidatus Methanomethylophilaceae archaeon]